LIGVVGVDLKVTDLEQQYLYMGHGNGYVTVMSRVGEALRHRRLKEASQYVCCVWCLLLADVLSLSLFSLFISL